MCDCVKNLRDKLRDEIHESFSKPNKPVQHFSIRTTMGGRAVVNIIIDLKNQMKPVESFMVADYCPWCGQKYEENQ